MHAGQPEPNSEQERMLTARREHQQDVGHRDRAPRVPGDLAWEKHGLQPRWLGMETSDCAIAIEPGHYHNRGVAERDRFLAGAARRGELALVVAVIGDADGDELKRSLWSRDASVSVADMFTNVSGRRLPTGTRPEIAPDLSPADRDLAIRLLTRPTTAPWWALQLHGVTTVRGDGFGGETHHPAQGNLEPILIDSLGDPVVAAWVSPAGDQRWYVLPDPVAWDNVLGWLTHSALPHYAPAVLRRARSPHFVDPDLQTADELAARAGLVDLEQRYRLDRAQLDQDLREAEENASPIRYGLLYGTRDELVEAVAAVLAAAGLSVVNLDAELGATQSADLLVSAPQGANRKLVEVKGAGGAAQENLVGYLQRHLDTWPQLQPDQPVAGGVLVVNHQHKLPPAERTAQVYTRPEFVATLPVPVLSSLQLFHWWRVRDWLAIRTAILGAEPSAVVTGPQPAPAKADPSEVSATATGRNRWWRKDRRGS
ncbi:hypothetical protein U2F26_29590 [Micromonospora sp. 4G57]|uniref:DUF91 domain-containing protein n=1 Tax=Micromonospora sicca TaxID=2202420 RepID=A0ABU5JLV8_9ACTN|nr:MULTISPECIES: hypothetical protein [unclassified Micromonospora]MDZ5446831.1 hypothetical protein [Micromonospora sp. 4G57]MDZ5493566.1 hypothetical protein [Micromonospora sp. 4G53]